jgi:choline dehydrogenase-like flavoprotein
MSQPIRIDLASSSEKLQEVQADVCVIGAGAAGIYLTMQLARQGMSVVLLEAGPARCVDACDIGFDVEFEAAHYPGATVGRFFGMGGSTSRWGGLLAPHTNHDLRGGATSNSAWPRIIGTVSTRAPQVLQRLGYRNGWDFEVFADQCLGQFVGELHDSGIHTQAALFLPVEHKNLVDMLGDAPARIPMPRVFINAVAKSWVVHAGREEASRVTKVIATARNNKELAVNAGKFVIAAGAIESARILLEVNESAPESVLRATAATGCYLADHLSVPIAEVVPDSLDCAARLFGPRFSGAWMRSFRFLEDSPFQDAPRAFMHFIFTNRSRGFALAKEVLVAMQGRRMPSISPHQIAGGMSDLIRLAYDRYVNSLLYIPAGSPAHLQLDMEQAAVHGNHVRLSSQKDVYGRRVASIHWNVSDVDMFNITETANRFLARWPDAKETSLPKLSSISIGSDGTKLYDAYHPVGTCRMGDDPEAVVDYNLKVWGVQNLWTVSTGVLPSAGTANPTFTMLCLVDQLAEHLQVRH